MLTKDQCEKILSYCMASEADFAELFEEHTTSESISMLNGEIEETNRVIRAGIGIRLYKDVQSVYGYTNEMEMEKIFTLADDLKAVFGICEEERSVSLKEQKMENRHPVLVDPIDAPLSEKVKLLERAYKTGKEESEKIVKITGSMRNSRQNVQISNSDGRFVQDVRVKTRMAITAYAKEKENMQTGSDGPGASQGLEFYEHTTPESIAKEACRTALVLLKAKDCPSGRSLSITGLAV